MKNKLSIFSLTALSFLTLPAYGQGDFGNFTKSAGILSSYGSTQLIAEDAAPESGEGDSIQSTAAADGPIVQQGGPYHSTGNTLQQFVSLMTLTQKDCSGRLVLTFFNGPNQEPKFAWVRVYLNNAIALKNFRQGAKPIGTLVLNERMFAKNSNKVQLDWSRKLSAGHYALLIIGAGAANASVKWRLNAPTGTASSTIVAPVGATSASSSARTPSSRTATPTAPTAPTSAGTASGALGGVRIASIQPTSAVAGGTLVLNGSGFTPSRDQNSVSLNQSRCRVSEATPNRLKVEIPSGLAAGTYSAQVIVDGVKSNAVALKIVGTAEIINSNLHSSPSDSTITISGNGFSEVAGDNEVTIGTTKASVVSATATELTVKVPFFPEADGSPFFLNPTPMEISLKVKGIPAKGHITFYCSKAPW
jgi:IPT/TIG domain